MESNVHLLAKLVPKITMIDGKEIVSSEEIFAAYILKMFWQGNKKKEDGEVCNCCSFIAVSSIAFYSHLFNYNEIEIAHFIIFSS